MTARLRLLIRFHRANLEGRLEEARSALLELAKVGDVLGGPQNLAIYSLQTNHPRQAVEYLRSPSLEADLKEPFGVYTAMIVTGALHQLGEHERELAEARRGISLHPDLLNMRAYEARALVALGRFAEVDALADQVLAMAPRWAYAKCCVPNGTPGYVLLSAAEELRAHGRREAALAMANRVAGWYRAVRGTRPRRRRTAPGSGNRCTGRNAGRRRARVFTQLAARHPGNFDHLGRLGTLAARRGARAEVERIDRRLQKLRPQLLPGDQHVLARPSPVLLGDRESALSLLRDAIAEGVGSWGEAYGYALVFRHSMDLEALRGDPAFEALLKPKD